MIRYFVIVLSLSWAAPCWAAIAFVSSTSGTGTGQTASITIPSVALNNVVYCALQISVSTTTCSPATWTKVGDTGATANGWFEVVYRRVLTGGEAASQTCDPGVGNTTLNWVCMEYSGENTSTPEDAGGNSVAVGNSNSPSVTGITTVNNGARLVFFTHTPDVSDTITAPSGFANSTQNNSNGQTSAGFDEAQVSAGATGTITATLTPTSGHWGAFLMAVRPAAATNSPWFMP